MNEIDNEGTRLQGEFKGFKVSVNKNNRSSVCITTIILGFFLFNRDVNGFKYNFVFILLKV